MTHRITAALHLIRDDLAAVLSPQTIRNVCSDMEYRRRNRILDAITTIHLFVLQILNRNTACTHLTHLSGRLFSASAYCQARSRLPLVLLERLVERIVDAIDPLTDPGRWRGHRTWLVDGTGVSMPDTANLQRAFGQPTNQAPGCGFLVARIFALFHAGTGFLMRMIVAPLRTHEAAFVTQLHSTMKSGDVLVGDRAFGTFGHLTTLISRGLHGVFRVAGTRVVDFTPGRAHAPRWNGPKATGRSRTRWIRTLGPKDQVVQWVRGYACPVWMTAEAFAALPVTVTVREVRYAITQRGFCVRVVTLVTTLLDPVAYPAEALADLYRSRWRVEVNQPQCPSSRRLYQLAVRGKSIGRGIVTAGVLVLPAGSRQPSFCGPTQARRLTMAPAIPPAPDESVSGTGDSTAVGATVDTVAGDATAGIAQPTDAVGGETADSSRRRGGGR